VYLCVCFQGSSDSQEVRRIEQKVQILYYKGAGSVYIEVHMFEGHSSSAEVLQKVCNLISKCFERFICVFSISEETWVLSLGA